MNAPVLPRPPAHAGAPVDSTTLDATFLDDVLDGLAGPRKTLSAKYFYDFEGSRLFEEITRLPEYYPTRTELAILRERAGEIGTDVPAGAALVEFGAGSSEKLRVLLRGLPDLAVYVPVDVSAEFVEGEAERLRADMPDLLVAPVAGDFTGPIALPPEARNLPLAGFFPGSTIGNFEPDAAERLLGGFADLLGPGSRLVIGVDLVKDAAILEAAYDDDAGVTARFNLNLLARINRELGADFDLDGFAHRALYDAARSRIEMHLVSLRPQAVRIGPDRVAFAEGETIHTENSYKYTPDGFAGLAARAGWTVGRSFTDPDRLFGVFSLRADP